MYWRQIAGFNGAAHERERMLTHTELACRGRLRFNGAAHERERMLPPVRGSSSRVSFNGAAHERERMPDPWHSKRI